MDKDDLLNFYGSMYGPEAGPWNLSVESKYLEYRITRFFEENFPVAEGGDICNIGIGAGFWDRYLSYRLKGGTLTSIDRDSRWCRNLALCLANEGNPNPVEMIPRDVMDCGGLRGKFHIVTMVGSARMESGLCEEILTMAASFLRPGGAVYYQSLAQNEDPLALEALWEGLGLRVEKYWSEAPFERIYHYWKIAA